MNTTGIIATLRGSDGIDPQPDIEYVSGYNSSTSTIAKGSVVGWETNTSNLDNGADDLGIGFILANDTDKYLWAGVAEEEVPAGKWTHKIVRKGPVQALVQKNTTNIAAGNVLAVTAGTDGVLDELASTTFTDSATNTVAVSAPDGVVPAFVALEAQTSTGTGGSLKKVYVNL